MKRSRLLSLSAGAVFLLGALACGGGGGGVNVNEVPGPTPGTGFPSSGFGSDLAVDGDTRRQARLFETDVSELMFDGEDGVAGFVAVVDDAVFEGVMIRRPNFLAEFSGHYYFNGLRDRIAVRGTGTPTLQQGQLLRLLIEIDEPQPILLLNTGSIPHNETLNLSNRYTGSYDATSPATVTFSDPLQGDPVNSKRVRIEFSGRGTFEGILVVNGPGISLSMEGEFRRPSNPTIPIEAYCNMYTFQYGKLFGFVYFSDLNLKPIRFRTEAAP